MRRENLKNGQFNQCHAELDSASLMRFRIKSGMTEVVGQAGRSMIEMLGVLAVVGLLSVMAFAAFRIALNKAKANTIVHDGRRMWVEALAWQNIQTPTDWIDSHYDSESGKKFSAMRDIKDNNYVKVEGVEEEVCERMLSMQQEGTLLFLTTNYEDLTTCQEGEHNTIVMAFDGLSGKPAECVNQKGCQDLHGVAFYCDGDGHCQECDAAISVVNEAGDGCRCNSNMALTCDDGNGHTWCCGQDEYGKERICGATPGECTVSNLKCHYYLTQSLDEPVRYTNCSYTLGSEYENGVEQGKLTPTKPNQCHAGEYCYLAYTDTICRSDTEASAGATGTLYGTCIREDLALKICNIQLSSDAFTLEMKTGCPVNKYCYLKWTEEGCSTEAVASDVGNLYGKCVNYDTVNPNSCL